MNLEALNPAYYDQQLEEKRVKLESMFAEFSVSELEVFKSAPSHYRMRTEFRIWHDGDDLYYYMFDKVLDQKVRCDQFLPASLLINQMMAALMDELRPNLVLRHKLFQVDFLSTLSGEILVSLLYHRPLSDEWITATHQLKTKLEQKNFRVNLIGRARNQKIVIDQEYVIEELEVDGEKLVYQQVENSFTQPNAGVAIKMLEWAINTTKNATGDLLELYCGNGNFSIALARNFNRVLATELAKPSVESAQYNIKANAATNVQVIRMSAEDFTVAMNGGREFTRLKGIDLKSYDCKTILVDPPRAGLDNETVELVRNYENILYISCNPLTLIENVKALSSTHRIIRFAMFDQFPYTEHVESGVFLEKIKN